MTSNIFKSFTQKKNINDFSEFCVNYYSHSFLNDMEEYIVDLIFKFNNLYKNSFTYYYKEFIDIFCNLYLLCNCFFLRKFSVTHLECLLRTTITNLCVFKEGAIL
jgi:hypothetical protein